MLIKSGLKWCWREVRERARASSIDQDSIPNKFVMMTHRYEQKTNVDKKSNSANSNGISGFRRISTISDLDLYDPGRCA